MKTSSLKRLLEFLVCEERMYHTTDPKNIPSILSKGLKINAGFDLGGKSRASEEYMEDAYGGIQPVFLSKEPGTYKGGEMLKVDVDGLPLVADIPGMVDFGGELTDHSVYWDEMSIPDELRHLEDPRTGEPLKGELEYRHLREPNNDVSKAAIDLTRTVAVPEDIDPTRIEPLEKLFSAWFDKPKRKRTKKSLTEAHFGKFNMDVFKRLSSLQSKHGYAGKHLQRLGGGSSRVAYALSTNSVLKIAIVGAIHIGKAQNKAEIDIWTNPKTKTVAAKIFDFDGEKYTWLVMEPAQEINRSTFNEILQLPPFLYQNDAINVINGNTEIDEFVRNIENWNRVSTETTNNIREYCKNPPPFVVALAALIKNNKLNMSDIAAEHFGKTADGRVVLFDYGCTEEVWDEHYREE